MSATNPILKLWALFTGILVLNLGNGLQGTLLGVRAAGEGFPDVVTGLMMASFFGGFLIGAVATARAVRKVGHIRVFAALTSMASVAILVHAVFVDPIVWTAMRFMTGICFAGIFVVAESWLNESADNTARGQVMAIYMMVTFGGGGLGQLSMNLAAPDQVHLFLLVSVLISVAAVPLLLSAVPAPLPAAVSSVTLLRLYTVSPLGVLGTFGAGLLNGSIFGMGAVFASRSGFSVADVALFMTSLVAGAAVLQWPIGRLSDVFDRRRVILAVSIASGGVALVLTFMQPLSPGIALFAAVALFGGVSLTLHALCIAYTNDYLEPTELIGASTGLVIMLALGSICGPLVAGFLMSRVGVHAFFPWLAAIGWGISAVVLVRMFARESLPNEDQGAFVALTAQASTVAVAAAEEVHAEDLQTQADDVPAADEMTSPVRDREPDPDAP